MQGTSVRPPRRQSTFFQAYHCVLPTSGHARRNDTSRLVRQPNASANYFSMHRATSLHCEGKITEPKITKVIEAPMAGRLLPRTFCKATFLAHRRRRQDARASDLMVRRREPAQRGSGSQG